MYKKNYFMKMRNFLFALAAIVSVFSLSSCQKEKEFADNNSYVEPFKSRPADLSDDQIRMTEQLIGQIPTVRLYDEANGRYLDVDIQKKQVVRDWTFADPTSGWGYVEETGVWTNEEGTEFVVVVTLGVATGTGGNVVAGGSALDIDFAFCFGLDVDAIGLDLFGFGGTFDGVSGVVGIAGDFEALMNDELGEEPEFEDFFYGFAMYIVYDGEANGTYEVLNWFEDLEQELDYLDNKAFSFVIDFVELAIYFSSDGSIQVSGGGMYFEGEYLMISEFLLDFEDEYEPEFSYVSGYGEMGCN